MLPKKLGVDQEFLISDPHFIRLGVDLLIDAGVFALWQSQDVLTAHLEFLMVLPAFIAFQKFSGRLMSCGG